MRPRRLVSSLRPMRPSSRVEPLTAFSLDVALYGTVALCATTLAGPSNGQDHVPVERGSLPSGIESGDGDVARQLPMERRERGRLDRATGVGRTVVVDHHARERPQVV